MPPTEPTDPNSTWTAVGTYNTGDQVTVNGVIYQAQWWTQGNNPETSGDWGVWKKV
ncbi:hypothetical protein EIJ81_08855 [Aliivibrio salmonicida]|nr:carbohydrate-binding protein [Aliivibrio salmonicida]AZL84708.1 hypothetical protein EIJ81_08855 [Aliivibrio salmonicida]